MKRILLFSVLILFLNGITTGAGKEAGEIGSINPSGKDIIVNAKSGEVLKMGDLLEIHSDSGKIILVVTFPMMTTSKCRIKGKGRISDLKKGMTVYRYSKDDVHEDKIKTGETENFSNIEMIKIPGGTFTMGSPESETNRRKDENQHRVNLSSFWIGKYEVTQKEYIEITGTNPSNFKGDDRLPVEQVSWYDAVEFCNKLSEKHGIKPYYNIDKTRKDPNNSNSDDALKYTVTILGGNGFRLPTEAEWEYACRAGTKTVFHFGNKLDSSMANFDGTKPYDAGMGIKREKTIPAGSFKPNAFGLYDMHGNVCEWCWDWHGEFSSAIDNPEGAGKGGYHIIRGGCWSFYGGALRSADRNNSTPSGRVNRNGFRLARSVQ